MSLEFFARQIITTPPSPAFTAQFITAIEEKSTVIDFQLQNTSFLHGTTLFGLICRYQHYDIAKHFINIGLGNDNIEISSKLSIFTVLCAVDPIPVELFYFLLFWYESTLCSPQISFTTLATWLSHSIITTSHIQFALLLFKRISHTSQTIFDIVALITNSIHFDTPPHYQFISQQNEQSASFTQTQSPFTTPQPEKNDSWLTLFQYNIFLELESFVVQFFTPELITSKISQFYYQEHARLVHINAILQTIIRLNVYLTSIRKYGPIVERISQIMYDLKSYVKLAGFDTRNTYKYLSQVILTHEYFVPHYMLFRYNFPINQYTLDLFDQIQTLLPIVPNYLRFEDLSTKRLLTEAMLTGDGDQKIDAVLQDDSYNPLAGVVHDDSVNDTNPSHIFSDKLGLDPMYSLYPLSQPRGAIQKDSFDVNSFSGIILNFDDKQVRKEVNAQMIGPATVYESDPRYRILLIDRFICAKNYETEQTYVLELSANNHSFEQVKTAALLTTHPIIASVPSLHQFSAYPILPPLPVYVCSIMNYFIHTQYPMVNTAYTLQFKFKNLFAELYQTHQLLNTIPQLPNPFNVIKSTPAQVLPSEKLLDAELTANSVTTRNDMKYSNEYRFIHTPTQFRLIPRNTVNNSLWPPYLPYDIHQNPTTNPLPSLVKHERTQIKAINRGKDEEFTQIIHNAASGVHIEGSDASLAKHKIHPVLYPTVLNDILYHHETMWTPEHLNPINKSQTAFQTPQFAHITGSYSPYDILGADDPVNIPRRLPFPFLPWQSWNRMQNSFILDKYAQYWQEYRNSKEAASNSDYTSLTYKGIYNDNTHEERVGSDFYDNHGLFERHFTVGFKKKGLLSRLFGGKGDKDDSKNKDPSRKESYVVNELCIDDDLSDIEFEAHHNTDPYELKRVVKKNTDITVVDNVREETRQEMLSNRAKILKFSLLFVSNEWFHHGISLDWYCDLVHSQISLHSLLFHTTFIQVYSAIKFFKKFLLNTFHSYYPSNTTQYNPLLPYITHPLRLHGGYVSRVDSSPNSMVVSTSTYTRSLPLTLWTVFDTNFNKNISSSQYYISIYDYTNPKIIFDPLIFRKLVCAFLFWNFAGAQFPKFITDSFEQTPSNAFVLQYQYGIANNHHLSLPSLAYYHYRFSTIIDVPSHDMFSSYSCHGTKGPRTIYASHQISQHTFGYLLAHSSHILYRLQLPLYTYGHQTFITQEEKENQVQLGLAKQSWDKTITTFNKHKKKNHSVFSNRRLDHREPKSLTEININFESSKFYDTNELTLARNGMLESLMALVHILLHSTDIIDVSFVVTSQLSGHSPHICPSALQGFLLGYAESSSKLWNPFFYIFFRNLLDQVSVELPKHYFSIVGRNIFAAGQQLNTVLGYNAVAQDKTYLPKTFLNLISTHGVPLDIPYLNDAMRTLLWSPSRYETMIPSIKSPAFLNGLNVWSPLRPQMFTRINLSLWDWMSPAGISLIYFYLMWFVQIEPFAVPANTIEFSKNLCALFPFFQFIHKIWIFFPFLKAYHRLSITSNVHTMASLYPAIVNTPYQDTEQKLSALGPYTTSLRFPILSQCVQDSSIYNIPAELDTIDFTTTTTTISAANIEDELCPYSSIPFLLKTLSSSSSTAMVSPDTINSPLFDAFGQPIDLKHIPENQKATVLRYLTLQKPPLLQLNPFQTNLYADHTFHYNHQNTTQFFSNCVNSNTFTSTPQPDAQIDTKKENQHLPSPNFCSTDPHNSLQFNNTYDHLRNKSTEYQLQVIEDLIHHLIFVSFETPVPPSQQKITQAYHSSSSPALPFIKRNKVPTPWYFGNYQSSYRRSYLSIQLGDWMMALNKYDSTIQQYVNYPIINTSLIKYFFFSPLNPYLRHIFALPVYQVQLLKQRNQHNLYHNLLLYCLMGWDSYGQKEFTEGDYLSFWKPFLDVLLQDPNIDTSTSSLSSRPQADGSRSEYFYELYKQVQLTYSGDIVYNTKNDCIQEYNFSSEPFTDEPTTYLHNNLLTVRGNYVKHSPTDHLHDSIYWAYDDTNPSFHNNSSAEGYILPAVYQGSTDFGNVPLFAESISHFFTSQEPFRTTNSHITHNLKSMPVNSHFTATHPHNINNAIDGRATFTRSLTPPLFNVSYQTYPSRLFQSKISGVLIDFLSSLFSNKLISIAQNILVINHTLDFALVSTALGNVATTGAPIPGESFGATLEIDPVIINTHSFRTAGGLDQNSPANHFPGAPAFKQPLFRGSIMEFLTENGFINGYQYALHFITQSHYDRRSLREPEEDISRSMPLTYLPSFDGLSVIFDNPVNNLMYVYGTIRQLWYDRPMYTHVPVFYADILRNFIQSILAKQYSSDLDSVSSTQSTHNISSTPQTPSRPLSPNAQSMPHSPFSNASKMQRNSTIGITHHHLSLLNMLFMQNDKYIKNEQGNIFGEVTHSQWSHGNRGGQPTYVNGELYSREEARGIDRRKIFYNNNYEPNCVFLIQESLSLLLHYYSLPLTIEFINFVDVLLEKATYIQPGVLFAFLTNSFQQHSAQYFSLYQRLIKYLTPPNDALFQHLTQMMTHTPIITLFGPLMGSTTLFTNQYTMQIIYSLLSFGMPFDYPYTQRDQLSNIAVSGEEYRFSQGLPNPAFESLRSIQSPSSAKVMTYKRMYPASHEIAKFDQKINLSALYNGPQLNESAILAYLQWSNLFTFDTSQDTQKLFSTSNERNKMNETSQPISEKIQSSQYLRAQPSLNIAHDESKYPYFKQALIDPRSTYLQLQLDPTRFSNELSQPAFTLLLTLAQVDITQLRSLTITPLEMQHKMTEVERKRAAQKAQTRTHVSAPEIDPDYDQQTAWSTLLYERAVLLNTQPELRRFCRTMTSIWFYNSTQQYSTSLYSIGLNREFNTKFSYRGMPQQYDRQYLDIFPSNRYKTISHAMMYNTSVIYQSSFVLGSILKPLLPWANLSDMFEQHFYYPKYADLLAKKITLHVNQIAIKDDDDDPDAMLSRSHNPTISGSQLLKVNDTIVTFPGYTINPSMITSLYQTQTLDQFLLAYAGLLYQMKEQVILYATSVHLNPPSTIDPVEKLYDNSVNKLDLVTSQHRQFAILSQHHVEAGLVSIDLGTQPDYIFYNNVAALVTEQDLVTPNPNLLNWSNLDQMPFGAKPCLGCFHKISLAKPAMYFEHLSTSTSGVAKRYRNNLFYSSCFAHSHQHWSCLKSFIERSVYSIKTPPHQTVYYMIQWILKVLEKRFVFNPDTKLYSDLIQSTFIPGYGNQDLPSPILISPDEQLAEVFKDCDPDVFEEAVQKWDKSGLSHVTSLYNEPFVNDATLTNSTKSQINESYKLIEEHGGNDAATYGAYARLYVGFLNSTQQQSCLSSPTDVTAVNTVELYAPTQMDIITPRLLDNIEQQKYNKCLHSTAREYFPNALYAPRWKSLLTYLGEDTAFQIEAQNEHILPKNYSVIDDLTQHGVTFPTLSNLSNSNPEVKIIVEPGCVTYILEDSDSDSDSTENAPVLDSSIIDDDEDSSTTKPKKSSKIAPLRLTPNPFLPTSKLDNPTGFFFYILNNVSQPTIDDLLLILQVNPQTNHQKLYQLEQNNVTPAPPQSIFSTLASSMIYLPTQQTVLMLAVLRRWSDECLSLLWNFVINQGIDVQDIIYQSDRLGFNIWDYVVMTNIQFSAPNFYELIAPYFPSEPPQ